MPTDPPSAALQETTESVAALLAAGGGFGACPHGTDQPSLGVVLFTPRPGTLYLGRLAVAPTARRQGIARALVAAVEQEAGRRGLDRITLGVRLVLASNRALFAALGYHEVDRTAHAGYTAPTSATMEKRLR